MDRPYVEELRIQDYGCIQDATFRFTPLHALIGPNDSGKSTVLRALMTLAYQLPGRVSGRAPPSPHALGNKGLTSLDVNEIAVSAWPLFIRDSHACTGPQPPPVHPIRAQRSTARSFSVSTPISSAQPRPLIPDGQPLRFTDERGTGLPALYDALIVRNLSAYIAVNQQLTRLFPSVKSIQLANPSQGTKASASAGWTAPSSPPS